MTKDPHSTREKLPIARVACFCDQVIQGNDRAISLIRIVDRVEIELREPIPESLEPDAGLPYPLTFFAMLDGMPPWIHHSVEMWIRVPKRRFEKFAEIPFEPEEEIPDTANLIFQLNLNLYRPGTYDVELRIQKRRIVTRQLMLKVTAPGPTAESDASP